MEMNDVVTFLRHQLDEDDRDIDESRMDPDGAWYLPDMVTKPRLRAEIKVKRQILDLYEVQAAMSGEDAGPADQVWAFARVVLLLTFPYTEGRPLPLP